MRAPVPKSQLMGPSYEMGDRKHLDKASSLFQSFRALDSTMPLQLAYTFILCATYEGGEYR